MPPCPNWIIFHTIVVHDPKVCHDLDQGSYLQGQGQCAHMHILTILNSLKELKPCEKEGQNLSVKLPCDGGASVNGSLM